MAYLPANTPANTGAPSRAGIIAAIRAASDFVSVADATAQAQAVTDWPTLSGAAISAANPVKVWRQDDKQLKVSPDGSTWYTVPTESDTSWQSPTLVNGWSGTLQVRRTAGGIEVRINALSAAAASNAQVTTLPAGWRPAASGEAPIRFEVHNAATTPEIRRAQIDTTGALYIYDYSSTSYYGQVFASVVD